MLKTVKLSAEEFERLYQQPGGSVIISYKGAELMVPKNHVEQAIEYMSDANCVVAL